MVDTVETAVYRLRAEGREQLAQLKQEIEQTVVVEERFGNTTRMTEQSLQRRIAAMDPAIKVQQQYRKELEYNKRITEEGVGTEAQRASHLALATQRYNEHLTVLGKVRTANDNVANSTKPARFELINLSRQIQDVGVSLSGGQSPFQVLIQQGTQIADIMAASNASVGSFFRTSIGWAGRFITSTAGVVTGLTAVGAAAAYVAYQWSEAQTEINRVLMTTGRNSGASPGDIRRIASNTSATTGASTGEARETALALAATGKLGVEQIERLTKHAYNLSKVLGTDLPEANKLLAQSFSDPVKGAELLNEKVGGIDRNMRETIKRLNDQFRFDDARKALEAGLIPTLSRAGQMTSTLGKIADGTSKFFKELGATMMLGLDRLTGNNPASDQLSAAQNRLNRLQGMRVDRASNQSRGLQGAGFGRSDKALDRDIEDAAAAVQKFQAEVDKVKSDNFRHVRDAVIDFAQEMEPAATKIDVLRDRMLGLEKALSDPGVIANMTSQQYEQAQRVLGALQSQVGEADKLRGIYGSANDEVNKQLHGLQQQLAIAKARTGAEEMIAQHAINITNAYAQTKDMAEAIQIADAQRAISVELVNKQADETLRSLREQGELIRASSEEERGRIRAAQEYKRLIEQQVDAQKAGAIAAQIQANSRSEQLAREEADATRNTAQAGEEAARSAERRARATANAAAQAEREAAAIRQYQEVTKFLPFSNAGDVMPLDLKRKSDGTVSQFDPEGYTSTIQTPLGAQAQNLYGGNAEFVPALPGWPTAAGIGSLKPNAQGYEFFVDKLLTGSLGGDAISLSGAIDKLLSGGGMLTGFGPNRGIDQAKAQTLSTLTDLIPDDQKIGVIQRQLEQLYQSPETIARDQLIKSLTDQLKQLQEATESNTDALNAQLDPLFSQGHEYLNSLRIGYYKAASGFDGVARGGIPGVDSIPFHAMVQDGERITITPKGGSVNNNNSRNVTQNITQNISIDGGKPVTPLTARQMAQGFISSAARAAA